MDEYQRVRRRHRQRQARRRLRRTLALLCAAVVILTLSAGITALLNWIVPPEGQTADGSAPVSDGNVALAPLPNTGTGLVQNTSFSSIGPVQQESWNLVQLDADRIAQPETGLVKPEYFQNVVMLGDSVTAGFYTYSTSIKGVATICGYRSIHPSDIVNRTTLTREDGVQEIALDAVAAADPKAVYVLLGTNSLVSADEKKEESFLAYYERMIQMFKEVVPDAELYIQSITPVRPEVSTLNNEQIRRVNEKLAQLALAQGCHYLDLHDCLADENGDLSADLAAEDGIHLNGTGYKQWVDYISRHVAYSADLPFLYGSPYATKTTTTAAADSSADSAAPEGEA